MAYPDAPDFTSGEPFSAWWSVAVGGRIRGCATQGRGFIKRLQRRLNRANRVYQSNVAIDGAWGGATALALAQHADNLASDAPAQGWGQVAEQLHADEAAARISTVGLRFALWVAYLEGTNNLFESLALDPRAVPPRFGVAPDDDRDFGGPDADASCWWTDTDAPPIAVTRDDVDRARRTGTPVHRSVARGANPATLQTVAPASALDFITEHPVASAAVGAGVVAAGWAVFSRTTMRRVRRGKSRGRRG